MNIFDDLIGRYDSFIGENPYEIYFLKIAVNIVRDISALCGYHEFTSFVALLVNEIVESCIDDLL